MGRPLSLDAEQRAELYEEALRQPRWIPGTYFELRERDRLDHLAGWVRERYRVEVSARTVRRLLERAADER